MSGQFVIAIDGGGTGTRAGLYDESGELLAEEAGAGCNPYQIALPIATAHVATLASALIQDISMRSVTIIAGISGARHERIRVAFMRALCGCHPRVNQVVVTTDVHAHLLGNAKSRSAALVVAGTGSSVAVLDADRETFLFGGRGPILGDNGSAYELVISALRASYRVLDETGKQPELMKALAGQQWLGGDGDFVDWCMNSGKHEIAALAETVLTFAAAGDTIAVTSVLDSVGSLARTVCSAVHRTNLGLKSPIFLLGGLFENSLFYRMRFVEALRELGIENEINLAPLTGHRAVFSMGNSLPLPKSVPHSVASPLALVMDDLQSDTVIEQALEPLDWLSGREIIERMQKADKLAVVATEPCKNELEKLMLCVAESFRNGGRLIYVGAGTSGRLGVLDASECTPTFGVPLGQVIGIIAGGDRALRESIEGAEDEVAGGRADIYKIDPPIGQSDVVVGIAASGKTPYTLAAIEAAKARGATTALICCDVNVKAEVDYLIALPVGTEVLPGSTRLKAGTATKSVLNTLTTGAMALSGRVFEGSMIHVQPTNEKLRKRAKKIISELTRLTDTASEKLLAEAGNNVAVAVVMHRGKMSADQARQRLARTRGDVRAALALSDHE